jgi:hypothetical protein
MRKQARRTKARKVASRLSCRTVSLRNPPSATRRTAPCGFEPSDRPSDARTPAFPLGFASPAAATPPESPSHHLPHPHPPPSAPSAPAPSPAASPASPPAPPQTDGYRAHAQAPPPPSREAHLHSPRTYAVGRKGALHMASDRPKHPIYGGGNDPIGPQLRNSYHQSVHFRPFPPLMPIYSYPFPPFFASTSVESTATASTFTFPSVYPQSRRACRIFPQTPFSWSS